MSAIPTAFDPLGTLGGGGWAPYIQPFFSGYSSATDSFNYSNTPSFGARIFWVCTGNGARVVQMSVKYASSEAYQKRYAYNAMTGSQIATSVYYSRATGLQAVDEDFVDVNTPSVARAIGVSFDNGKTVRLRRVTAHTSNISRSSYYSVSSAVWVLRDLDGNELAECTVGSQHGGGDIDNYLSFDLPAPVVVSGFDIYLKSIVATGQAVTQVLDNILLDGDFKQ